LYIPSTSQVVLDVSSSPLRYYGLGSYQSHTLLFHRL
jgi:hypothetical protein